ncbi:hypothetical protein Tco_0767153 [Tanacetum coccineum]
MGMTRTKKYAKLSAAEKIQADCDMKATNIILQGLPADIYSLVNHHRVAKDLWERVQLLMQGFAVPVFSLGDDPIAYLNKAMAFLTAVASSRVMLLVLGETMQVDRQGLLNATTIKTEDLDTYDSDCDDISIEKAVLMANISNYGSDVISEAQQDSMILSVIEQMSEQMINHVNNWENDNKEQNNESVTAELERYKE